MGQDCVILKLAKRYGFGQGSGFSCRPGPITSGRPVYYGLINSNRFDLVRRGATAE